MSRPILLVEDNPMDLDLAAAYTLGANSYLVKPLEYEDFLSVTEQIREYWVRLNLTLDGTVRP